jgi:hypothetical protein
MNRPQPTGPTPVDWQQLAAGVDALRESLRAAVAGLVDDGFTEDQARAIVAAVMAAHGKPKDGPKR